MKDRISVIALQVGLVMAVLPIIIDQRTTPQTIKKRLLVGDHEMERQVLSAGHSEVVLANVRAILEEIPSAICQSC